MTGIIASVLMVTFLISMASCNQQSNDNGTDVLEIGIIQFAPHPSLDNCYEGFVEGLKEAGFVDGENIKIDFQNAQGEMSNSDMIAKNMAASKYDMISESRLPRQCRLTVHERTPIFLLYLPQYQIRCQQV